MKGEGRAITHQKIYEAVVNADDPITSKDIAEIIGMAPDTVREHICELRREGKVKSTSSPRSRGGREYAHEAVETPMPLLNPEDLTDMGQLLFDTVTKMNRSVPARLVAKKTGRHLNTVCSYLADLAKAGYLGRHKAYERPGGRWEYVYFASGNVRQTPEAEAEAWFMDDGFAEAIEAARPHWCKGELFTRKEVADWREVNIRRRR